MCLAITWYLSEQNIFFPQYYSQGEMTSVLIRTDYDKEAWRFKTEVGPHSSQSLVVIHYDLKIPKK